MIRPSHPADILVLLAEMVGLRSQINSCPGHLFIWQNLWDLDGLSVRFPI